MLLRCPNSTQGAPEVQICSQNLKKDAPRLPDGNPKKPKGAGGKGVALKINHGILITFLGHIIIMALRVYCNNIIII